jgi:hypothetical protein
MFATDMRTGKTEVIADKVDEQLARFDRSFVDRAIDAYADIE